MTPPTTTRIGTRELVRLLGSWHSEDGRRTSAELASAIRALIVDGTLAIGGRLPAERELAAGLGASRTLVTAALDRLRDGGFIRSQRGSGSWTSLPSGTQRLGLGEPEPGVVDLARAAPEPVPWLTHAVDAARLRLPGYLDSNGYSAYGVPVTRERLARWFTERGLPTEPDQILVTGGALAALSRVLEVFTTPGGRCVLEQPCYANTLLAINRARLRPIAVPLREHGWDPAAFETAMRTARPSIGYLIPDFQNPTGMRMREPERERFGRMLARAGIPFIVDETMVELDYAPDRSAQPLAKFAERAVITIGSASKSHWGGLRIGWIRAPREWLDRIARTDLGAPIFEQLLLAELLENELEQRRDLLRARRDALVGALREHCPQWRFQVPEGGLAVWCELPEPSSTRLTVAAREAGIWLVPGGRFSAHGGLERWLRVPFAQPAERLEACVRTIAEIQAGLDTSDRIDVAPDVPMV